MRQDGQPRPLRTAFITPIHQLKPCRRGLLTLVYPPRIRGDARPRRIDMVHRSSGSGSTAIVNRSGAETLHGGVCSVLGSRRSLLRPESARPRREDGRCGTGPAAVAFKPPAGRSRTGRGPPPRPVSAGPTLGPLGPTTSGPSPAAAVGGPQDFREPLEPQADGLADAGVQDQLVVREGGDR